MLKETGRGLEAKLGIACCPARTTIHAVQCGTSQKFVKPKHVLLRQVLLKQHAIHERRGNRIMSGYGMAGSVAKQTSFGP